VVDCLVSLEMIFPPSFFNIMTHLMVHIITQIGIVGLVFLHNMFPFEQYMGVLKKYVHNDLDQKAALPMGMEQRRSQSSVLTTLMISIRLAFLYHAMREG